MFWLLIELIGFVGFNIVLVLLFCKFELCLFMILMWVFVVWENLLLFFKVFSVVIFEDLFLVLIIGFMIWLILESLVLLFDWELFFGRRFKWFFKVGYSFLIYGFIINFKLIVLLV